MPSPTRRSTRGAPPTKPNPPASSTSSSSLSSGRPDRAGRAGGKQKSVSPQSLSSEDVSEPPRRSQRSHLPKSDPDIRDAERGRGDDGLDEEEEVTRCVCNHQEYPGPPLSEAFVGIEVQSDDAGGLFISCDGCSVWQHGGCVGIIEDNQVPDKYYCEQCRPKLHDLHVDSRGQSYSLYLPLHPKAGRKQSISKHVEKPSRDRETPAPSRLSADPGTGRRRATMRSKEHDDEEEQFLRAIEESKREVGSAADGRPNGKRSREESEDKLDIKRQRTTSQPLPSLSASGTVSRDNYSDDDGNGPNSRAKKMRAEAVHSARQAETREKDLEREKARAEAAGRRQERAGRRRADDGDHEETPKPDASARDSPVAPSSRAASPPPQSGTEKAPPKRGGPGRKTKKPGNNQYTRNRDSPHQVASSPHSKRRGLTNNTHQGVSSGDEQPLNGDVGHIIKANSPGHDNHAGAAKGKFGRAKKNGLMNGARSMAPAQPLDIADMSIPEMSRQISAMAAFMARAQGDLAGDRTPPAGDLPPLKVAGTADDDDGKKWAAGGAVQPSTDTTSAPHEGPLYTSADGRKFEDLSATEMADVLSRNMTLWEAKFAGGAGTPQTS